MLSDCVRAVEMELQYQENTQAKLIKTLKKLDDVKNSQLVARVQKGKIRYFLGTEDNGKRKYTYLNQAEESLRHKIQERYYLERAIPRCSKNIEMLEMLHDSYFSLDPDDVVKDAPLAYKEQINAKKLLYGYDNEAAWKRKKLSWKSKFDVPYPEGLKHVASDGTPTRSISEAVIIDLLNMKGIPYVYDYPLYLGMTLKWPDFIIWDRKHQRELLIEHLGLVGDEDYLEDQNEKIKLYIQEGYVPNVNLLLTYNDKDGNINVPAISKMIDAFMCI